MLLKFGLCVVMFGFFIGGCLFVFLGVVDFDDFLGCIYLFYEY